MNKWPNTHRGRTSTRNLLKRNCRGGVCVPVRTFAQRRFHTKNTHIMCGELSDKCALVGRHGRAHRHRPYQTPSYFSTQSHTNQIIIYAQSSQTTSTVPYVIHPNEINRLRVIHPNETVGAVPICPPERSRSGVPMPKIHTLCAGN